MRALSWTLILLALISALWAFLLDLARASAPIGNPYKTGISKQLAAQSIATLPKKQCVTRDHGPWGPKDKHGKRTRIKTTWCREEGRKDFNYVMTWVGKWSRI